MNSSFTTHYIQSLATSPALPESSEAQLTSKKQNLQSLVVSLKQPLSRSETRDTLHSLEKIERDNAEIFAAQADKEEYALKRAVLGKIVIGLYAEALDTYLSEASEAEAEAEWWADVERSRRNVAYYFVQTLPLRLLDLTRTILQTVRTHHIPLTPSIFTPSSLRRLFPSANTLRPNALTTALFPHLQTHTYTVPLSYKIIPSRQQLKHTRTTIASSFEQWTQFLLAIFTLPYDLTRHECQVKRNELEKIRDERAEVLGTLTDMRDQLANALMDEQPGMHINGVEVDDKLASFVDVLRRSTAGELGSPASTPSPPSVISTHQDILQSIQTLANSTLQTHVTQHRNHLHSHNLNRPSRFILIWPRLLILPPLSVYLLRAAYRSRASLMEIAKEAVETLEGFFTDWLLEPVKGIIKTIRAGGEEGVIVTKQGVAADMDSLERMTLALAKDKLNYSQVQLVSLSKQIRLGDLTPVLEIYEEDIKNPVKSAVTGTLLRSVFVQIQKAKVDIDQALAGIDKLLKSQELTFAFVGVAPAFAIVYLISGYLRSLWMGGRGRGKYGGKKKRTGVWVTMRRIERLLVFQPKSNHHLQRSVKSSSSAIPALTSGLLILSVTHLRTYAETYLSAHSTLREGFLEDVQDLEDPGLGRTEKLRVVDRMWKSWGDVLGWGKGSI